MDAVRSQAQSVVAAGGGADCALPKGSEPHRMRPSRPSRRLNPCAGGASIRPPPAKAGKPTPENAMAKGQMRSNKEKKKPKAEWNKKKKGGPALSPFAWAREQPQPGQNPFAKKSYRTTARRLALAGRVVSPEAGARSQRYSAAIIPRAAE